MVTLAPVQNATDGAGFVAIALLIHEWDLIAPWLIEELFPDEPSREAFRALADHDGNVHESLQHVAGPAADIIERASVYDGDADPEVESRALIAAAVRRELAQRRTVASVEQVQQDRQVRIALEDLNKPDKSSAAKLQLLQWLAAIGEGNE
jgi:hypothetical protein